MSRSEGTYPPHEYDAKRIVMGRLQETDVGALVEELADAIKKEYGGGTVHGLNVAAFVRKWRPGK